MPTVGNDLLSALGLQLAVSASNRSGVVSAASAADLPTPSTIEHVAAVQSARLPRGLWRHPAAHSFFGGPQAFLEEVEGDPPMCFDKKGQVCNKSEMSEEPDEEKQLDFRMHKLQEAQTEDGFWPSIHEANVRSLEENAAVRAQARNYESAQRAFERAFETYQAEAARWAAAIRGLEDDYALYCRPFHDVTMECEKKWRTALKMWFAREPLPQCAVGVVTPFQKNPSGGFLSSIL